VLSLIPHNLRDHLIDQAQPGEKHRWMYDQYSLKIAMQTAGFGNVKFLDAFTSDIANFKQDGLDTVSPTLSYKNNSIYSEASKV
jgi:YD repeat-containing protein